MSSFFTAPASQRKRKRTDAGPSSSAKRSAAPRNNTRQVNGSRPATRAERDESISGSDSDVSGAENEELGDEDEISHASSEDENETAADKRLRLAERYLENIRDEIDPAGFDAADVDRDLIAERLREDVAESKGKVYRNIASQLDISKAQHMNIRDNKADQRCPTGVATVFPFIYTVAKDLTICKWEIPSPTQEPSTQTNITNRRKPKLVKKYECYRNQSKKDKSLGHTAPILCIAVSSSGKYLATGGADKRLVIWDAESLKPIRVFFQHRDSILGVSFRRNTNTLYTASADRTIKIWSLDEMSYIETLFGHQDHVVDIVGLAQERCISVGSRDRTARFWKVVDESQLVFRGGGGGSSKASKVEGESFSEGSIDRVAMVDEDTFVTGSDNGTISLWSVLRKKPVFSIPMAHGIEPLAKPEDISPEINPSSSRTDGRPQPRWITALTTVPYSDIILSGSWDGYIRAWKISEDKRRLEAVGPIQSQANKALQNGTNGLTHEQKSQDELGPIRGLVNDLNVFEKGDRGKDGLCIVAAYSKEHRLGKWNMNTGGRCGTVLYEIGKILEHPSDPTHLNGHAE
ncbi:WD40 repeat-like protein [Microthyrium microscopicum]|uniref:WD40 repeat-like protein n=1 Tax=Microthyrium microscopicum TaxID=703497 RepID=A0A6A6UDS8_9PEZI|nr:WD40 repeat-like protein [Microthyrium microscopicum]